MKICIATPPSIGVSETFIQAVVDGLGGETLHICGHGLNFKLHDVPIGGTKKNQRTWKERALDILPRFLEYRLRRKLLVPKGKAELLSEFLESEKVDVVLAQYGTLAADLFDACALANIPLVPHFHGFEVSRRSTVQEYREKFSQIFRYCDRIIAVSGRMKNDLIELGCDPQKVVHVVYAPHPSFFDVRPDYQSNTLVMVGRLTDQKAPHLSILAFAKASQRCANLRLRVVGDGELRSVCRDLVQALGLQDKVEFLGAGGRELVQKTMSNAFLFMQHSIEAANGDREGTPVAILEAGASALPVVSTIHAGIPDVVVQGETGLLVHEGDVDAMAEAICRFATDRSLSQRMGAAARSHIQQHWTMERHLFDIQKVLTESVDLFRWT